MIHSGIDNGRIPILPFLVSTIATAYGPMCLAIPGKVLSMDTSGSLRMGRIDFGGVIQEVCLEYTPEISVGDYAIVHVGFAIAKLDIQRAEEILSTLDALAAEPSDVRH
jgi:hydrogenase assembly chaperone HypC/HupF